MKVSIIVAIAHDNVIGKNNDLVWHLPKDMKFFMDTTLNHFVIMGRKNYDSIPEKYRPLKNRTNVVVTRNAAFKAPNCVVVSSIKEGIEAAKKNGDKECFIIGGGQIYKESLEMNMVDKMYITHIDQEFEGDTFFPQFNKGDWNLRVLMEHQKDEKNTHDFIIVEYTKKV
ncbi:MAG: dihydrofolate reductase [Bacteroidetes bacterium]|nr:dihydrofolate reductase [Bacteroidota bacterium]